MHIITPRMHLIPATVELLHAELRGPASLSAFVGAYVPPNWPPEYYDEQALRWMLDQLSRPHADNRWYTHYFVLQSRSSGPDVVIGVGGYVGPPDPAGVVEIGYSILPEFQRRGLAAEAAAGLTNNAFLKKARVVIAHTLQGDEASGGVLLKNGFRNAGEGPQSGTTRYEITKAEWSARFSQVVTA